MKFFVLNFLMIFDFFHKRKILEVLKKLLDKENKIIFDVGAHNGESIIFFNKYFQPCNFYTFEPLEKNFSKLKINTKKIVGKIIYFNSALGDKREKKLIKEMIETSSSTLNDINENSNYYRKKKFFLGIKKNEKMFIERSILIEKGTDIIKKFNINKIDLLKIDTEGYEFKVIKGFGKNINKIDLILFEHHYDLMIKKEYTFSDINDYLIGKGFQLRYKFKMPFRKTFEYIYSK